MITQRVLFALQACPVELSGVRQQSLLGRGQGLLILAARALAIERRRKLLRAQFLYSLPTEGDAEDTKLFCVELVEESGQVLIGFTSEVGS